MNRVANEKPTFAVNRANECIGDLAPTEFGFRVGELLIGVKFARWPLYGQVHFGPSRKGKFRGIAKTGR